MSCWFHEEGFFLGLQLHLQKGQRASREKKTWESTAGIKDPWPIYTTTG
jgi:hypothetical protein